MEPEAPVGEEFESLVRLIVNYRQPRLEALDPKNSLLECRVSTEGDGIEIPPEFGNKFYDLSLNTALDKYYRLLTTEINRLEATTKSKN